MDPIEKRELKRQARLRLAAQRRRAGLLRGRVVVLSMICFALLWGIVFMQMATGNDPVLSAKGGAAATRTASTGARQEVETTDPRELRPHGEDDDAEGRRRRGGATLESEPEADAVQTEPEEIEPELVEEPLVTSQS